MAKDQSSTPRDSTNHNYSQTKSHLSVTLNVIENLLPIIAHGLIKYALERQGMDGILSILTIQKYTQN